MSAHKQIGRLLSHGDGRVTGSLVGATRELPWGTYVCRRCGIVRPWNGIGNPREYCRDCKPYVVGKASS